MIEAVLDLFFYISWAILDGVVALFGWMWRLFRRSFAARRGEPEPLPAASSRPDEGAEDARIRHEFGIIAEKGGDLKGGVRGYRQAAAILSEIGSPDAKVARRNLERLKAKLGDEEFDRVVREIEREQHTEVQTT